MSYFRQRDGRVYYKYTTFRNKSEAIRFAWKLRKSNKGIRYKITLNGNNNYILWLSGYNG